MELLKRGVDEVMYTANSDRPADPQKVLHGVSEEAQKRLEQVMETVERQKEN